MRCHYDGTAPPPGFPVTCTGRIAWQLQWKHGMHYYCEGHGSAHASMSPFAGYARVSS